MPLRLEGTFCYLFADDAADFEAAGWVVVGDLGPAHQDALLAFWPCECPLAVPPGCRSPIVAAQARARATGAPGAARAGDRAAAGAGPPAPA